VIYPVDSTIQLLNKWGLDGMLAHQRESPPPSQGFLKGLLEPFKIHLAPDAQRLDNFTRWLNHYSADKVYWLKYIYQRG